MNLMTNKKLREALLNKLGISSQALWQQCQRLKRQVPLTTEDDTYIIAHKNAIKLDKYLDNETINHIRNLYQQLIPVKQVPAKQTRENSTGTPVKPRVIRIGKEFEFNDPILPQKKINEANEMSYVYPRIYVLENSIRELIDRVMTAQYGNNWWDSQSPKPLRDDVATKMSADKRYSWHQRRGARPIDYLDFKDLPRLMNKIADIVVPDIISDLEWFRQLVKEVYKSRCVVCHMNPLEKNNIKAIEVKFNEWEKQINAKKEAILRLSHK